MPQSFTKLYAHLVFSTKDRASVLDEAVRSRVHAYIASMVRGLESPYVVVGGVADHVHILFDMGKLHAPVEFVEQVKRESSKFVKTLGEEFWGVLLAAWIWDVFGQSDLVVASGALCSTSGRASSKRELSR